MTQLHSIIAAAPTAKTHLSQTMKSHLQQLGQVRMVAGLSENYEPVVESPGNEPEAATKPVQARSWDAVQDVRARFLQCVDLMLRQDKANAEAKADIKVKVGEEEQLISANVPVTHLLWLEKRLQELESFVRDLPELPTDVGGWALDTHQGVYRSPAKKRYRTRKVEKPLIVVEASDKFPAQAKTVIEDEVIGTITRVDESGAVPHSWKRARLDRIVQLREAVVAARVQANSMEVSQRDSHGGALFDFVFNEELS